MSQTRKREGSENEASIKRIKLDSTILDPNQTLYVKNLNDKVNYDVLIHNLYLIFSTYGDVIEINMKRKSKQMRGQAHVVLDSTKNATLAIENLQGTIFFNKPLVLNYSNKKSKVVIKAEATLENLSEAVNSADM